MTFKPVQMISILVALNCSKSLTLRATHCCSSPVAFHLSVVKPKPKAITRQITTDAQHNEPIAFEANICTRRQARENARANHEWFWFCLSLAAESGANFLTNHIRNKAKLKQTRITFAQLKIVLFWYENLSGSYENHGVLLKILLA